MRTETKTYQIYKFEELTAEAQQKAYENYLSSGVCEDEREVDSDDFRGTLDEIMALSEAAAAWNIPATTLQGYCLGKNSGKRKKADTVGKRNYFLPDEARKCGGRAWIVTKAAMYRLFGPPAEDRTDGVRKTGKEAE